MTPTQPEIDAAKADKSRIGTCNNIECLGDWITQNNALKFVAKKYKAQAERIKDLESEKKALLKTKFLSCPGPDALVVADDYETLGWWVSHEIEACHPHQIVLRAAFESDLSEARKKIAEARLEWARASLKAGLALNYAMLACLDCGSGWYPNGYSEEWHEPGCVKAKAP